MINMPLELTKRELRFLKYHLQTLFSSKARGLVLRDPTFDESAVVINPELKMLKDLLLKISIEIQSQA